MTSVLICPAQADTNWTYYDFSLSGLYSSRDSSFGSHSVPPRTFVGFEYVRKFTDGPAGLSIFDIYAHLDNDPVFERLRFYFLDARARFEIEGKNRFGLRYLELGHFRLPYGIQPFYDPRGVFVMPLTVYDLGYKYDWGMNFIGDWGKNNYEVALTNATGLGFHWVPKRYLLCARVGTPRFKDLQYGFSLLYGEVPMIMLDKMHWTRGITRQRIAFDFVYDYRKRVVFQGEFLLGRNDEVDLFGYMWQMEYVPPRFQNLEIITQLQLLHNAGFLAVPRSYRLDNSYGTLGFSYSIGQNTMLRLFLVHNFNVVSAQQYLGKRNDSRLVMQLFSYGLLRPRWFSGR
ncbi:hypothetical protein ACFLT7_07335 [candidate division KSB1 bacterium]